VSKPKQVIFVIGASGTGKSTVAKALADCIEGKFLDADDFHSAQNKASMANGVPLTDEMRAGWLETVCKATNAHDQTTIVACSALKKIYRARIRSAVAQCKFVFLQVDQDILAQRMANRPGHFMPVSLLESQLRTLELPSELETDVVTIDGTLPINKIVEAAIEFGQT